MIISWETAKKAMDTLAEYFYNYLSSSVVELDLNDKEAEEWLVERTNEFVRLPSLRCVKRLELKKRNNPLLCFYVNRNWTYNFTLQKK